MSTPLSPDAASADAVLGTVHIAGRALRGYISAIVADELGTRPGDVSVTLGDERGLLAVRASAPLTPADSGAAEASRSGAVKSAAAARSVIQERMVRLTGRSVGRVDLTITRRHDSERARVR
jgi:hypothetical protein